jgi:hypothetical protein
MSYLEHIGRKFKLTLVLVCLCQTSYSQSFFTPGDTFNSKRYYTAIAGAGLTYAAFSYGLYQLWYADYPQSHFRLFNDWNEWENMDKFGHSFNGYFQSHLLFKGAKWTGLNRKQAMWHGVIGATLFQTTVEVMDGFSEQWGFSVPDIAFNTIGTGIFALQEHFWQEQRIKLKMSAWLTDYPTGGITSDRGNFISYQDRAEDLYGSGLAAQFVKDYNAQIQWASINVSAFAPNLTWWPGWLNVAVGYGANNVYGGFDNEWETDDGEIYVFDFQRQRQYYLSFDLDLEKLDVQSPFWKSILSIINIIKIPAPALEYNSDIGFRGHWLR